MNDVGTSAPSSFDRQPGRRASRSGESELGLILLTRSASSQDLYFSLLRPIMPLENERRLIYYGGRGRDGRARAEARGLRIRLRAGDVLDASPGALRGAMMRVRRSSSGRLAACAVVGFLGIAVAHPL